MDIIILALITAFIFYKLNKNLGNIDEEEKQQIHKKLMERKKQIEEILERAQKNAPNSAKDLAGQEKIIGSSSTNQKHLKNLDQASQDNLQNIFNVCNINYDFFINGAKMAFEMIINAFASEDKNTLKILLSEKIYNGFEGAINERQKNNQKLITNLIAIDNIEIMSALLIEKQASIVVKFNSKQINYLQINNETVQGKKEEIHEVTDIWTFKKDVTSNNPNWIVAATSSN